ncbi:MAG: bifunctional oligoribonuclease/PAP phosphatase NrnA [Syntrophobacteraceae bacterium]|nr:bifunctional oligoribonuclease/PAP phosphatase NrnA [Syntrophobacteraceae bacterium]
MNDDNAEPELKIKEFFEAHRGEKHIIVLQDFPDPDAISSAYAHQLISEAFDIECDIVYNGRVSHQQNIALVKLIGIELVRFDGSVDFHKYAGAIYLDNQGTTAEEIVKCLEELGVPALAIIDHHEFQHRIEPAFQDIRRSYGATATIYAHYLEQGLIRLDKHHKEHVMAATALSHGIITDTGGLIRAGAEDFHAAAYLSQYRDPDLLEQILNQARPKRSMDVIHRALEDKVTVEGLSIAGVGYLRTEDRDAIPLTADFLVTEENVHTAIVYGVVSGVEMDECIVGSLRTSKLTLDPDEFLKEIFGKDCAGRYFGGGKASSGGFKIPIGFLSGGEDEEFRERKWRVFDEQIKHKLLAKIGAKGPDGAPTKAKLQLYRRVRSSSEHGESAEGA